MNETPSSCPICSDPATPAWLIARNTCPNERAPLNAPPACLPACSPLDHAPECYDASDAYWDDYADRLHHKEAALDAEFNAS